MSSENFLGPMIQSLVLGGPVRSAAPPVHLPPQRFRHLALWSKLARASKSSLRVRGPSAPDGPNGPLRGAKCVEIPSPLAGGAARSAAP
eukprot:15443646-Alexandrium_andersonii.AAC.1